VTHPLYFAQPCRISARSLCSRSSCIAEHPDILQSPIEYPVTADIDTRLTTVDQSRSVGNATIENRLHDAPPADFT
jgi:hypothetical protein